VPTNGDGLVTPKDVTRVLDKFGDVLAMELTWPDVSAYSSGTREWEVARLTRDLTKAVLDQRNDWFTEATGAVTTADLRDTILQQMIAVRDNIICDPPTLINCKKHWQAKGSTYHKRWAAAENDGKVHSGQIILEYIIQPWAAAAKELGRVARSPFTDNAELERYIESYMRPPAEFGALAYAPSLELIPAHTAKYDLPETTGFRVGADGTATAVAVPFRRTLYAPAFAAASMDPTDFQSGVSLTATEVNLLGGMTDAQFNHVFNNDWYTGGMAIAGNQANRAATLPDLTTNGNGALRVRRDANHMYYVALGVVVDAAVNRWEEAAGMDTQATDDAIRMINKLYWHHIYDLHFRWGRLLAPAPAVVDNENRHWQFASGSSIPRVLWRFARLENVRPQQVRVAAADGDVYALDGWLYVTSAVRNEGYRLKHVLGRMTLASRDKRTGESAKQDSWLMFPAARGEGPDARVPIYGLKAGSNLQTALPNGLAAPTDNDSPGHVRAKALGGRTDPLNFLPQSDQCNVGTWYAAETFVRGLIDQCPRNWQQIHINAYYGNEPNVINIPAVTPTQLRPVTFDWAVYMSAMQADADLCTFNNHRVPTQAQINAAAQANPQIFLAPVLEIKNMPNFPH